ncbi:hypothetical protein Pmani_034226 [Petrolisthes manimaculis]|uniref:Uncharacterized protein n=1 Tax=Petrolisthes manimaculis TaxID=1843537 RepID=A0AAE1TPM2_9EUCA|nr:hypothetical protein Pmani_034226 [Petrolisthes manimaculis]
MRRGKASRGGLAGREELTWGRESIGRMRVVVVAGREARWSRRVGRDWETVKEGSGRKERRGGVEGWIEIGRMKVRDENSGREERWNRKVE